MTLTSPTTNYASDWEAYVASLEEALEATPDPIDSSDDELALAAELHELEDKFWIFKDHLTTDNKLKRRLQNGLYYMAFQSEVDQDEYSFFLANMDQYDDQSKAYVLNNVLTLRDTLNKIINKLS